MVVGYSVGDTSADGASLGWNGVQGAGPDTTTEGASLGMSGVPGPGPDANTARLQAAFWARARGAQGRRRVAKKKEQHEWESQEGKGVGSGDERGSGMGEEEGEEGGEEGRVGYPSHPSSERDPLDWTQPMMLRMAKTCPLKEFHAVVDGPLRAHGMCVVWQKYNSTGQGKKGVQTYLRPKVCMLEVGRLAARLRLHCSLWYPVCSGFLFLSSFKIIQGGCSA